MDRKWYQSKKFAAILVAILAFVLDEKLELQIEDETLFSIVGLAITFIVAQFGLDLKDRQQLKTAIQDPVVRDAIESLVSEFYDYGLAKSGGISQHSLEVKEKVMEGLSLILDPKFQKDAKEVQEEIVRLILKMYKEDNSMTKGADLVRSTMKRGSVE